MNSRIIIAATSAAVIGIACVVPIASSAQTAQPSGVVHSAPNALSEGTALPPPQIDPSKVRKSTIAASAQPTAAKTGDLLLEPQAKKGIARR
jgi:hypothetical protein